MKTIYEMTLIAGLAFAQQDVMIFDQAVEVPSAPQARARIFARAGGEVIKGAAYSAESINEHTQVLADGNRIKHINKSVFARDAEGRTRRETTIQGLGPVGQTEEPVVSIFIDDPVAKVQYTLDSQRKLAMKSKFEAVFDAKIKQGTAAPNWKSEDVRIERKILTYGATAGQRIESHIEVNSVHAGGKFKNEELGTRTIEGVTAKGTKITMTIAAGEVGNERPMEVVTETWYSDEIKAVVLTRHSDPRTGEMVTKLTNVKLGNPASSLFEPPTDYKIEEVSNMRMPMPMPAIRVKEDR
jgi:hypothetical protein